MNKKILLIFTALLSLCTLSSCKSKMPVELDKCDSLAYNADKENTIMNYTVPLNSTTLKNKMDNLESFAFVTYRETCEVCQNIEPYLLQYIQNSHYVVNSLNLSSSVNTQDELNQLTLVLNEIYYFYDAPLGTPRIFFIYKGQAVGIKNGFTKKEYNYKTIKSLFDFYAVFSGNNITL